MRCYSTSAVELVPSASDTRVRTLWPMPGGAGSYISSLRKLVTEVQAEPSRGELLKHFLYLFPQVSSEKTAGSYIRIVEILGLARFHSNIIELTAAGEEFLGSSGHQVIRDALLDRVYGVSELYRLLEKRALRIGLIRKELAALGIQWQTDSQIRHRLRWMEEVQLVERGRPHHYVSYRSLYKPS